MTIDDFEWVERGFDDFVLIHKTHELSVASLTYFNGWRVVVLTPKKGIEQTAEFIDNFETAKVIAAIHVNRNMEGYPDGTNYRKRAAKRRPEEIPEGVFKMARVRP
jgi:hypothetical protein